MKKVTEDEIVRWHHQLNGHGSEQTPGDNEGQGSLACCSPWGRKESDTTEQLNNINSPQVFLILYFNSSIFLFISLILGTYL